MIYWEKKGGKSGEGEQEREREMRCHWGILLSPPVFPPLLLSCPFNLPPPSLSLFFLFSSPYSPISNANFLHCDPGQLALLFYLCLLLALSLVVYLSPPPLPLSPSLTVTAGMQLFNEHSSASSPCSSVHHFSSVSPCCISTRHCVVSQQHSPVQ